MQTNNRFFRKKNRLPCGKRSFLFFNKLLFSFETVATGTAVRVAIARIAYVNFTERTIIARTVVLAIGYTTADTGVHFLILFVHHSEFLLTCKKSMRKTRKDY